MPKIQSINTIDVTPEKFLEACDSTELKELELLLSSHRYQAKMRWTNEQQIILKENIDFWNQPR